MAAAVARAAAATDGKGWTVGRMPMGVSLPYNAVRLRLGVAVRPASASGLILIATYL
jgi:hypothetical protein